MDQETIAVVERQAFPNLPDAPFGGGVGGDVRVEDTPGADFHNDEHINNRKRPVATVFQT